MKLGIINSAFAQAGVSTAQGLEHISRIGFDCVDIFVEAMTITGEEKRLIANTCERNNLAIVSLPVVSLGLIDFNDPVRTFHIQRCKRFIELAAEFQARNIVLVLGEYIWQREVIAPEDQWQWAVDACRVLGDYAGENNVDIALELEPFRLSLLNNVHHLARFLKDCNHPNVQANIDISHLVLSDCGPGTIKSLASKIAHVHISDCDGKVHGDLPPGRGIVKFGPYLEAIRESAFEGAISIELEYSPDPAKIIEWVEEAYRETDRLMRLHSLRN
jgi:sugar phosphate isomerase/epimerase